MEEDNPKKEHLEDEYLRLRRLTRREMLHRRAMMERAEARAKRTQWTMAAVIAPLIAMMGSLMSIYIDQGSYIDKKILQEDIATVVKNDGDLRAIKQALISQPRVSDFKTLFSSKDNYYPKGVALSVVLDDVRLQAFRVSDKTLLPKLEPIINEYEETNPFDNLQAGQKDYFENIRIKTGGEYQKISNDVNNLADELFQQNQLVTEYLSDSKMSFWISVVALCLSLLIGGYQIFSSRPAAMRKILLGIIDDSNSDQPESSNKSSQQDASEAGASA